MIPTNPNPNVQVFDASCIIVRVEPQGYHDLRNASSAQFKSAIDGGEPCGEAMWGRIATEKTER